MVPRRRRTAVCRNQRPSARIPETGVGTGGTTPGLVKRTQAGRRSSVGRRATIRRPARHSGHGDDATRAHSTLSAETTHVQVFYPFHPLHNCNLPIVRRPKRGDGAVSVIDPTGRRLKIPLWMLSRDSAEMKIVERAHLSRGALLSLTSLVSSPLNIQGRDHDNLLQTVVDGCKGGHRAATTISGPDSPKRGGPRADRPNGTNRIGRPHGPHSGGGVSTGKRESE